jgi:16S rRNA A1518/A1519 N6-dimethyltransferase RsmA/KsgA/DIM1 with predicted DNA glycosylase/AP lyase activity
MIQKEVGEKIKSDAGKKSMLWFLLNFNYDVKYLRTVPAKDFTPPPKVDSCLVSFEYT